MVEASGILCADGALRETIEAFEVCQRPHCSLIDRFANLLLRPTLLFEDSHMLRAENQYITSTPVHCPHHRIDNRPYEALTCAAQLAIDIMESLAGKDGDSTDIG